jgi:Zn-dependent protease with chaperone function
MMAVLFQAARVGWETAGMIGFWESYIIGVPFTFVEYWMRRRFYESSLFNGRPTWVLALASVLSWHGYTYLMIIDLARDIKHRWWR